MKNFATYRGLTYKTGNNGHGLIDLHGIIFGKFIMNVPIKDVTLHDKISVRLKKTEINGYNQIWCYGLYNHITHEWLSCDSCLDECINEPKNNHMKAKDAIKLSNENSAKELEVVYGIIKLNAEDGQRSVRVSNPSGLKSGTIRQLEEDGYEVSDETLVGILTSSYLYVIRW